MHWRNDTVIPIFTERLAVLGVPRAGDSKEQSIDSESVVGVCFGSRLCENPEANSKSAFLCEFWKSLATQPTQNSRRSAIFRLFFNQPERRRSFHTAWVDSGHWRTAAF